MRANAVERFRVPIRPSLGMQNCKSRIETRLRVGSGNGSPRQGDNMVTDPIKNIVTNPACPCDPRRDE